MAGTALPGQPGGWAAGSWAARRRAALVFLRFGTVGTLGFAVDTGVVYALRGWIDAYAAGFISYLVAASCTWALNRCWTFRHRARMPARRQWALFLGTGLIGLIPNRGTYVALIALVPVCAANPILATAAGAIAGMGVNFFTAHRLVFKAAVPLSAPPVRG